MATAVTGGWGGPGAVKTGSYPRLKGAPNSGAHKLLFEKLSDPLIKWQLPAWC